MFPIKWQQKIQQAVHFYVALPLSYTGIIIHHVRYLLALGDLVTDHSYRYDHLRVTENATAALKGATEVMNDGAGSGIRTTRPTASNAITNAVDSLKLDYAASL